MTDTSVYPEIRFLLTTIHTLAVRKATTPNASGKYNGKYVDFAGEVSVATSIEELRTLTGWTRNNLVRACAVAEDEKLLSRTGSSRTGYVYTILISLKSYRSAGTGEVKRSLFGYGAERRITPPAERQLPLGSHGESETLSTTVVPKRKPRSTFLLGTTIVPKADEPEPPLNTTVVPKAQDSVRQPYPNPSISSTTIVSNTSALSTPVVPKTEAINVRARAQNNKEPDHKNLSDPPDLPDALLRALLLLIRKTEPQAKQTDLRFLATCRELVNNLDAHFGDFDRACTALEALTQHPEVRKATKPFGQLLNGTRKGGFLLGVRALAETVSDPQERAFLRLPGDLQESLRRAIEDKTATRTWCRERDIPHEAVLFAARSFRPSSGHESGNAQGTPAADDPAWLSQMKAKLRAELSPPRYALAAISRLTYRQWDEKTCVLMAPNRLAKEVIAHELLNARMAELIGADTVVITVEGEPAA